MQTRTVLITGASKGLGEALALQFAAPGVLLVLHGRDCGRLQSVSARCILQGATVQQLVHDLRDHPGWMEKLAAQCVRTPIDLLVVNAGIALTHLDGMEPWDDVSATLDVNLTAAIATATIGAAAMCARGKGQIALVSSLAAYVGMPQTPAYCASKAGLKAYGEALRARIARHGVGVTVVLPGFVATDMSARFPAATPFIVSSALAARHIAQALRRNPARISFPQPLAFGMWVLSILPPAWSQRILRVTGYAELRRAKPRARPD